MSARDLDTWVTAELTRLTARHSPPWRDAAESERTGTVSERYAARFTPEAWIRDNAVEVDPQGPQEWDCTEFAAGQVSYLAALAARFGDTVADGVVDAACGPTLTAASSPATSPKRRA